MKKAIAYIRVSTDEQTHGYSLASQLEIIRRHCEFKDIEIAATYSEDYSAKTFDRPEMNKLREYVRQHPKVDFIFVSRWDRFSRNAGDAMEHIRGFARMGIEVNAVEQPIDFEVPEQKMMLALFITMPEVDNDRRSINTRRGMRAAQKAGRYMGPPPYGYRGGRDEKNKAILVKDEEKAAHVLRAFEMFVSGVYSLEDCRRRMSETGMHYSKHEFRKLLSNPVYIGKIAVRPFMQEPEELVDGIHKPIVSEELFDRVQLILSGKKRRHTPQNDSNFPLRGFLVCPECGKLWSGSASRGKLGGRYHYYHCTQGCKARVRAGSLNDDFVSYLSGMAMSPMMKEMFEYTLEQDFKKRKKDQAGRMKEIKEDIRLAEQKLFAIDDRYIAGEIDRESYERLKGVYRGRKAQLTMDMEQSDLVDTEYFTYMRGAMDLACNLDKYYQRAPLDVKRFFVGSIFPQNLTYFDGTFRTPEINEVIAYFCNKNNEIKSPIDASTGLDAPKASLNYCNSNPSWSKSLAIAYKVDLLAA